MKVNFDIVDNHALSFEGRHIDLHNNFDFTDFDYDVSNREVRLYWKKSSGSWVVKNEFSDLVLIHTAVTFLNVIGQDDNSNYDNNSCLGEITFFPSTAREINDRIFSQSKPNEGDDIIYFFENGQRIRIQCEQVELRINYEQDINLVVAKNEALVLFEFLARLNETEYSKIFEDQAEQKILWILEEQLEKQLAESFRPDYKNLITVARNQIRDGQ